MSSCLSGTVTTSAFGAKHGLIQAALFDVFPASAATMPLTTLPVATDGTWAFDGLSPWAHYYVQIVASFGEMYGPGATVGPLSVPSSGSVDVQLRPVQVVASEHGMGGSFELDWASAYAFDPSSGHELQGSAASLSIAVGGTSTAMPWTTTGGQSSYFVQFTAPPPAQDSYTLTASGSAFGSMAESVQVTASPPSFTPSVTTMVSQGQLSVSWPAGPPVDYVTVAVFSTGGALVASTAAPVRPDQTSAPKIQLPAGDGGAATYLVDTYFTSAACPTTADACVLSSAVAATQVTAQ